MFLFLLPFIGFIIVTATEEQVLKIISDQKLEFVTNPGRNERLFSIHAPYGIFNLTIFTTDNNLRPALMNWDEKLSTYLEEELSQFRTPKDIGIVFDKIWSWQRKELETGDFGHFSKMTRKPAIDDISEEYKVYVPYFVKILKVMHHNLRYQTAMWDKMNPNLGLGWSLNHIYSEGPNPFSRRLKSTQTLIINGHGNIFSTIWGNFDIHGPMNLISPDIETSLLGDPNAYVYNIKYLVKRYGDMEFTNDIEYVDEPLFYSPDYDFISNGWKHIRDVVFWEFQKELSNLHTQ